MKSFVIIVLTVALGIPSFIFVASAHTSSNKNIHFRVAAEIQDSYIFVFNKTVPPNEVKGMAHGLANKYGGRVTHLYKHTIKGFAAKMPEQAVKVIAEKNPNIAYIEPDAVAFAYKKPTWAGGGGGEEDTSCAPQVTPWGITRVVGEDLSLNDTDLTAWVIDTGIDLDHPDLNVSLDFSDGGLSKNVVASRGKKSRTADDGNGHGTHVAGTIAAKNDDCDVVGVAAGATVVAVRVLDNSGSGSYSGVIAGVDYVAANASDGDVANMSLGGPPSDALDYAVKEAADLGIFFSLAAGNDYHDDANNYSPARVDHVNVYTVSAIDSNDKFASFSNIGNPPIDYAAPGVGILSTKRGGGTTTYSGTSMAAPHVAGILLRYTFCESGGDALNDPDNELDEICVAP